MAPIGSFLLRFVFLPLYRTFFFTRLRLEKALASTRGFIFLIFTNRYTLHILVLIVAIPAFITQFATKSATADVGQQSILYALVTNGQEPLVQDSEPLHTNEHPVQYLAEDLQVTPGGIDDDSVLNDDPTIDHSIDGSIAWQPVPEPISGSSAQPVAVAEPTTEPAPTEEPTPAKPRELVTEYVIRRGDTIATIARRFGVDQNSVLWANNLKKDSTINPGKTLRIPAESGVLYTVKKGDTLAKIANTYDVALNDVATTNHLKTTSALSVGKEILLPGAVPISVSSPVAVKPATPVATKPATTPITTPKPATTKPTKVAVRADIPIARIKNKAFDVYQELTGTSADTRAVPVDHEDLPVKAGKLLWPTQQHVINQYYGWQHTGVDLDGDYTDAIYASEDGVVETAGWNSGGYGLQIVIDHDNGIKTRYAHSSKLLVKQGETVKRGQVIGMVGTTGRSTGTHLHYEVYVGGVRKNPLAYIK